MPYVATTPADLLACLSGIAHIEADRLVIDDEARFRSQAAADLAWTAAFTSDDATAEAVRWVVWEASQALGARSASIQELYMARGRGEVSGFTVPALNIRAQTFDMARTFYETAARAEAWPTNNINIIVPFPAGGSVDQLARIVQSGLQQKLGATVIVENKPGAQGSIGTGLVARAKPDGGTWVMVFDTHAVNPALQAMTFDTEKDLDPVLLIGTSPHLLCTHPGRPWKSFTELAAAAKKDPGKLTYGSIGTGSLGHLTMVLLTKKAGIEMTHVPYRGGGPLLNDILPGQLVRGQRPPVRLAAE